MQLVQPVLKVFKENKVPRVLPVLLVQTVLMVLRGLKVFKETKVQSVLLVRMVLME